MSYDDFDKPLGINSIGASPRRIPYRLVAFSGLAIVAVALFVFVSLTSDPMGGEPYAVAAIHRKPVAATGADGTGLPPKQGAGASEPKSAATDDAVGSISKQMTTAETIELQSGVKVTRGNAGPPGALILTIPPERDLRNSGVRLAPAPDPRLVEKTPFGVIPRIGPDGTKPSSIYARPALSNGALKSNAPRVAILIGGMGLDAAETRKAIATLPGAVTLGFAPYGASLDSDAARARAAGHEIVLQLPMEPFGYPQANPGPHSLLTSASLADNTAELHWLMSRFAGYAGVANFLGAKLTSNGQTLLPLLREIAERGLYYLDDGTSSQSLVASLAPALNLPMTQASVVLEASEPAQLDAGLTRLEAIAREKGIAVGVASGLPSGNIERIARFAQTLEAKGINLLPISAVLEKERPSPIVTREP